MNQPQLNAPVRRGRRAPANFPPLLHVLRDRSLYPMLRALLRNEVARLVTSKFFTYRLQGDEILLDPDQLKIVVGAIGKAIGNERLRVSTKRLSGLEGQFTMSLSSAAKQALMLEMAALLANLSGSDLDKLPPVDSTPAGASQ